MEALLMGPFEEMRAETLLSTSGLAQVDSRWYTGDLPPEKSIEGRK